MMINRQGTKPSSFARHRIFFIILFVAIIFRIAGFIAVGPWDIKIQNTRILKYDALMYHSIAQALVKDHSFDSVTTHTVRAPGYPGFIAIIYECFGERPEIVLAFQLVINIITLIVIYSISVRLFSKPVGIVSTLLYSIDPFPVFYSLTLLTETLFTFVFLSAIAFLLFGMMDNKKAYHLIAGLLLGLSMLIRPIVQYFPLMLVFILMFSLRRHISERIKACGIMIVGVLIVVSPWLCRNYLQYDTLALTTQKGESILLYNIALMESFRTQRPFDEVREEFTRTVDKVCSSSGITNPFEISNIQLEYANTYLKRNPLLYMLIHVRGMINLYISPDTRQISNLLGIKSYGFPDGFIAVSSFKEKVIAFFKYKPLFEISMGVYITCLSIFVYLCTLAGFFMLYQHKQWLVLILFLSTLCYFTILTGPIGYSRYKVPIIPIYTIIGAYGLYSAMSHTLCRRLRPDSDTHDSAPVCNK